MTSFVHVEQPASHPGVDRAEAVFAHFRAARGKGGSRGLAAMLLAAVVSAMMVVADRLIDQWTEGSLLAVWVVLWVVAFLAMALFADTARTLAVRALDVWKRIAERAAARRADARFLETAKHDPRIMNDLRAAITRSEPAEPVVAAEALVQAAESAPMPTLYEAMRSSARARQYQY